MSEETVSTREFYPILPFDIPGAEGILELAIDLHWSWHHGGDQLWRQLDEELWERTHNAWVLLKTVSREKLKNLLKDPAFSKILQELLKNKREREKSLKWFEQNHPNTPLKTIAYFSMEYMLSEALPIYSGGLGNVAGDQLKVSNDLGVPVVAIGLLYQQGYFRQIIDRDGNQQALYPYNDPGQLPITPVRNSSGEWLRLAVTLPEGAIWLRVWEASVGSRRLFLIDTNDAANSPVHRGITSELYGGGSELRLKQEMVLGMGGWRLLEAMNIHPEVCHLNEGHAAFAVLERARSFMLSEGCTFDEALSVTRAGNLFTTHTAVPAGFDRFSPGLMDQYLGLYAKDQLKITFDKLMGLGRENPDNHDEPFNMAYLAIRGSGAVNGVSRLHGRVSRQLFQSIFNYWPEDEVPIDYVTNGVHMLSWDSLQSDELWTSACGKSRWLGPTEGLSKDIEALPDGKIWQMRNASRKDLIDFVRKRVAFQWTGAGYSPEEIEFAKNMFDPGILTIGFARRFATYKRPNMLLKDPERLIRILNNAQCPVQLILSGKAHPADEPGKALIRQWSDFIRRPDARSHVVFLSDYDMFITERLVQGVDVWLNTPRRPWEACGTSGMKVLVNGGINVSELDGWWEEAFSSDVGWALGDCKDHGVDLAWDASEADALYDMLEKEIIPAFYNRDAEGIPIDWVRKIRTSMAMLTPHYSANRAVREYTEKYYIPLATSYQKRAANKGALGKKLNDWKQILQKKWHVIRFEDVKVDTREGEHFFEVRLYIDEIDPDGVQMEIFSAPTADEPFRRKKLNRIRRLEGSSGTYLYSGSVISNRPSSDFTPRVTPFDEGAAVPLEAAQILWQK